MEEGNDSSLKLSSPSSVDGGRREALPDNGLTDVGGNEEGDTGSKAISLLEQLIQKQDNEAGHKQLDDDQEADTRSDVSGITIHASHHVDDGLADGDDHTEHCKSKEEDIDSIIRITI